MAENAINGKTWGNGWRIAGWGTAAFLLLLPLLADAPWTASDFVFAGILFGGVGLALELAVRKFASYTLRAAAGVALAAALLTIWVNGAVGMIGSEDNPFNLWFAGVLLIALVGAFVARLEPSGMARAMVIAAIAQLAISAAGLSADMRGGVLSMGFAGLWLLSAALFARGAREQSSS